MVVVIAEVIGPVLFLGKLPAIRRVKKDSGYSQRHCRPPVKAGYFTNGAIICLISKHLFLIASTLFYGQNKHVAGLTLRQQLLLPPLFLVLLEFLI
ncbi:hypothetical protein OROMI_024608 [Orobanche minor]